MVILINHKQFKDINKRILIKENPTAQDVYNFKNRSRSLTKEAIKKGLIWPKRCRDCGEKNTVAHHPNYSFPYRIVWLCGSCHTTVHKEMERKYRLKKLSTRKS